MNIFVVPINAESEPTCKECTKECTKECSKEKAKDQEQSKEQKIRHCDIYEEMIRISINNPYNW